MPTSTRGRRQNSTTGRYEAYERTYTSKSRSAYSTEYERAYRRERIYSGTGTAYDIPVEYPKVDRTYKKPVKKMVPARGLAKYIEKRLTALNIKRAAICIGIFFALCVTVLYRYGIILTSNQTIKSLEARRDELLASNQALQTKIDKQLEINEIEKYAKTELGMMKPQAYQIYYIDMNMQDNGTDVKTKSSEAVKGVPGTLINAFKVLK